MKTNIAIVLALMAVTLGLSYKYADAKVLIPVQGEILHFPIHEIDGVPFCKFGKKCDKPVAPTTGGNYTSYSGRGQGCIPTWTDNKGVSHYYACYFDMLKAIELLK